jgi:carbamoyl-phosphate synthase large subunit
MTCVIVTAVGSLAGYGVVRSLRHWRPQLRLVGLDAQSDAVGREWCDDFACITTADQADYRDALAQAVVRAGGDVIVPTHPTEIEPLSTWSGSPTPIAVERPGLVHLASDKLAMSEWLSERGEPTTIPTSAITSYAEHAELFGTPFIVKPRVGSGSKGVRRISSEGDFTAAVGEQPETMLAQALVGTDDEEYSAAVFGDGHGGIAARIVLRRTLDRGGWTRRATSTQPPGLDEVLERLCGILRPRGASNLQLRRSHEQWWLLELNPRISSSTSIRSRLGYPEASMAVDFALDGSLPRQPVITSGTVVRYLDDRVLR